MKTKKYKVCPYCRKGFLIPIGDTKDFKCDKCEFKIVDGKPIYPKLPDVSGWIFC